MALNHKKLNGVRKSPNDHVKLKAMTCPNGEKRVFSSTRTSPRSPRRPITETLQVDVELANYKYNSVSPGRRCISDSRVNSARNNIEDPPKVTRKRKIEFDDASKISASKFYKSSTKEMVYSHSDISKDGNPHLELDANQNIKENQKTDSPNTTQLLDLPSPSQYKSQHRIGSRRAANSFFSYSETTLSSPWKIISSKPRTKSTCTSSSTSTSTNIHKKPALKSENVGTCSSHANGEVTSETSSEQDSVFEDDLAVQHQSKPAAGVAEIQKLKQRGNISVTAMKRKVGRPKKSEKMIKEEEGLGELEKKKELPDVKPPDSFVGFRMRRLASLDAETKVHLMFEKEEILTEDIKRSKAKRRRSKSKSDPFVESKLPINEDLPEKEEELSEHFVATKNLSMELKESQIVIPQIPQECNIAGKVTCLNCGSETPAIYIHPPAIGDNGLSTITPIATVTLAKNHFNLLPSTYVKTSSQVSELFNDPDALMRTLSQLAGQRSAPVDSAECDHFRTLFKNRLTCRLSGHSISEGEMERISSTLANQLASLINTKYSIHLSPSQTITSTIARQKLVRKIIRPPGLKPAKQKLGRKKSTNGWRGVGDPVPKPIVYLNEAERELRYCYESIKRKEDVIKVKDCVLLRSGTRKKDIPFVAKISAIFEDPETGEIMVALLWYYRPEHTESGRQPEHVEQELFACRHWDINNVACIEDKCYVLPMSEYCRYQSDMKREVEGISPGFPVVPDLPPETRYHERRTSSDTASENVFLCRQVYDYKQRRLLKNPNCKFT